MCMYTIDITMGHYCTMVNVGQDASSVHGQYYGMLVHHGMPGTGWTYTSTSNVQVCTWAVPWDITVPQCT